MAKKILNYLLNRSNPSNPRPLFEGDQVVNTLFDDLVRGVVIEVNEAGTRARIWFVRYATGSEWTEYVHNGSQLRLTS